MVDPQAEAQTITLNDLGSMAKLFGSLFYYPLTEPNNRSMLRQFAADPDAELNGFEQLVQALEYDSDDTLNNDFFLLFEGGEIMHAPPWGSVYLDKEQVIFGDSLLSYRSFLKRQGIELNTGMREPEDQFGLMLFAMSQLIETNSDIRIIKELLTEHLLVWCYRYLELVEANALSNSYKVLAQLAKQWCEVVQSGLEIQPETKKIYR
ncbi:DMSO reductase [Alginatibacterium sediminis]|uniref:DMSO reductase n=1 Tax=Alginatibacterium sediminis TaxID=2164068 RepID=A0A420EH65_9ALTE|nr:molecular chaperone TorD family protein [Alginatibacterium sediminis]RKF20071.1 DMSO reductase [Alginatibacterium sediminis]